MLTIPVAERDASNRHPNGSRRLPEAARDPSRWHRPSELRAALRDAIDKSDLPANTRTFGIWLEARLDPSGSADVAEIVRLSQYCRATTFVHLRKLEDAGLIERHGSARRTGPGEWTRTSKISAAARFRPPDLRNCHDERSDLRKSERSDFPWKSKRVYSDGPVGDQPSDRNAHASGSEQITADERRAVDEHWPLCAQARSDLPSQREGYSTNATGYAGPPKTQAEVLEAMIGSGRHPLLAAALIELNERKAAHGTGTTS